MIADTETWTANFRCGGWVYVGMVVVVGKEVGGGGGGVGGSSRHLLMSCEM